MTYDVCAAVVSDLSFDARVWKEVRSLAAAGHTVAVVGCVYDLERTRRRDEGRIAVVEVPLGSRRHVSLRGRAVTLLRLWREVVWTRASVYHAHNVHVAPAAWLASRIRRAKLVYDAHELYGEAVAFGPDGEPAEPARKERLAQRLALAVERFMVRHADEVITTNASRARVLEERHGRPEVLYLANVPPTVREVKPLDPGFRPGRVVLLYQGGIYATGRAFRETIVALRELDDVDFAILGFGREQDLETIRRWAREENVADRVFILPPRPFSELVGTAAAATLGIVPIKAFDINTHLGDTNKLFEYLMAGLPIVASDLPEIRAVATAGDPPVGEVFDPTSPASIAASIRAVIDDPERLAARRAQARQIALDLYNWEVEEQRLLAAYERLLPQRSRPQPLVTT